MKIDIKTIKDNCYNKSYIKGVSLNENGMVYGVHSDMDESSGIFHASGDVEGSSGTDYHVWFDYDVESEDFLEYECECPAFFKYPGMCKHCVALALKYASSTKSKALYDFEKFKIQQLKSKKVHTAPELSKLIFEYTMQKKAQFLQPDVTGNIDLEPTLIRDYSGWSLGFRVGAENKYVVKDIHSFLEAIDRNEKVDYGKKLGFIHEMGAFTKQAQEIISYLKKYIGEYRYYHNSTYYMPSMRYFKISDEARGAFLHMMVDKSCNLDDYLTRDKELFVVKENPTLYFGLERLGEGGGFSLVVPEEEAFLGNGKLYLRSGRTVYECDADFTREMGSVCRIGKINKEVVLDVEEKDMSSFCSSLLPVLKKYTQLKVDGDLDKYIPHEALIKIYIDYDQGVITAKMEAEYGEKVYDLTEHYDFSNAFRDIQKEAMAVKTVESYFEGISTDNRFWIDEENEDMVYHLLTTGIYQIEKAGEVYISEAFQKLKVTGASKITVGISVKGGLLDLQVDAGNLSKEDLKGMLQSYRQRKKYHRLKNGDFIELEDNGLAVISELADGLNLKAGEISGGSIEIPKYRAFYLDQVLKSEGTEVHRDASFKSMIRNMKDVEDSDYEVPVSLKKVMRNYQKTGFRWLCTLDAMGFGGILADDMGLGKTLQIIGFLLKKKEDNEKKEPTLIVCPASLVYNWESEIEKFAPDLNVLVLAGGMAERRDLLRGYKDFDVIVTSYDLLKRDIEEYEGKHFFAQVIDEAQNIKNHTTQASKAVKFIQAEVKFALTGTPIENRLSELWSIFDYLMPGLLNSYEKFKTEYETPIVQAKDEIVTRRLQKMIKPFILRRLKSEVLKDLPEKEENVIYSKLEGEQNELYRANVNKLLETLNQTSKEEFQTGKIQLLAQLTRLRQVCCAPSLVYEDYKGGAAKLDTCMELIKNAVEGGHKILVFSQFTSLFGLLEKELEKAKIRNYKLTGATAKSRRAQLVAEFNENDVPVFLISLKAGGTGLNLTGASIVIHFDPWWNVAAQNQATDRAHRIGQKNTVSVYKLIAKNTIEEKILLLQEAKKNLSDQIISEDGVSVSNLSKEDFMGILETV
ncbi:SNF2 helicase associated domain-containing protein [Robinsoniella peoriensis]|uniref:SNF2 helicase associated domain-containing protein n=1 Tax=Robinsoniella peoriensis TaxID=180332 RepID=UPI003753944B